MGICRLPRQIVVPSSGPQLGDLEPGTLISINENGVDVPFIVLAHNHHAEGRTTVMRQQPHSEQSMHTAPQQVSYGETWLDNWLNSAYFNYLDEITQNMIMFTSIECAVNIVNGSDTEFINRKIFLLSATEMFSLDDIANCASEGSQIAYFLASNGSLDYNKLEFNTSSNYIWTRSANYLGDSKWLFERWNCVYGGGNACQSGMPLGILPAFTLSMSMKPIIYGEV